MDKDIAEFLDKYLAHLERKDSREGATKWILLAAIAALAWKLIEVTGTVNLSNVVGLLSLVLVLYWIVELTSNFLGSRQPEHREPRFFSRDFTRPADAKRLTSVLVRLLLTTSLFGYAFYAKTEPSSLERWAFWAVVAPILIVVLVHIARLSEIRGKYEVAKKVTFTRFFNCCMWFVFIGLPVLGLIALNQLEGIVGLAFRSASKADVQFVALSCGILFLIEKYTRLLRVDGEVAAVRRIWRRLGLDEIDSAEARKELNLIMAGANLSEVISSEVADFMQLAEGIERQSESARNEFDSLKGNGEVQQVVKDAVMNSLRARFVSISADIEKLGAANKKLMAQSKKLLGVSENEAIEPLKRELDSRLDSTKASYETLIENIRAGGFGDLLPADVPPSLSSTIVWSPIP